METDETRIATLRSAITRANQEEAKAEVAREEARKQKEIALHALVEEFQVEDEQKGRALLVDLRAELESTLVELEQKMEKLED
jgi:hypothetical protein